MGPNSKTLRFLRRRIPAFDCVPGCHDCCGPVTASSVEMARLPEKTDTERAAALDALSCPHLGDSGCQVYAERPLVCRLFGTTPRLACPNGKRPAAMIDRDIEQRIYQYFAETRHVLV
jgi:Fe-S-cluster containining protein